MPQLRPLLIEVAGAVLRQISAGQFDKQAIDAAVGALAYCDSLAQIRLRRPRPKHGPVHREYCNRSDFARVGTFVRP